MSSSSDALRNTPNEKVYELRKRNFQRNFVSDLSLLGYITIILAYIKFDTSFWVLLSRLLLQSLLTSPFPDESRLQIIAARTRPQQNFTGGMFGPSVIPGSFPTSDVTEEEQEAAQAYVKQKIRKFLFHGALTFNTLRLIWVVINPVNFADKFDTMTASEKALNNAGSPYANSHGLINGERRGGVFLQLIGEHVFRSKLCGNLALIGYEFLILVIQYSLFVVTCINLTDSDRKENDGRQQETIGDGYDGTVFVSEVNYNTGVQNFIATPASTRPNPVY